MATLYDPLEDLAASSGSMHGMFRDAGVEVVSLGLPRPRRCTGIRGIQLAATGTTLLRAALMLRHRLIAGEFDLLDAHLDGTLFVAVPAARSTHVPVAVTLYHAKGIGRDRRSGLARRLSVRHANALFTDSQAIARDLRGFAGRSCPPVFVIPNGVRLPPPTRSRSEVLQQLGLPATAEAIVGQVSGLAPYKGHLTFLRAARRVLDERPGTYFLLIGFPRAGEDYVHRLHQETRTLGIEEHVRFCSYAGSISDVWQLIDVHAHASELDSLPNAIIEGMSLGKGAVVTAVGGVPELVAHEHTGLVVSPADPSALAAGLLRLLRDPALRQQYGARARQRYLRHYTPEVTARQTARCFDAISREHTRPCGAADGPLVRA